MDNVVGKWMRKAGRLFLWLVCMMLCVSCASGQGAQDEQADAKGLLEEERGTEGRTSGEESGGEEAMTEGEGAAEGQASNAEDQKPEEDAEQDEQKNAGPDAQKEEFSPERQMEKNEELFLEKAKEQKVETALAEELFGRLLTDRIFQDGGMALTGLIIDDIDGNGRMDMLVMVLEAEEQPFYGSGGLWFYMNEDEPYCFEEEDCSFYGWFNAFWADVDNDENVEIVFSAEGTGCGAVGDSYKAVFKYKDHAIERMALPSDLEEDYDCGLRVELVQEPQKDIYSAYCPYFDELIVFQGENAGEREPPESPRIVGGNARGYYDLCVVEYEGKKMLQASEYLFGEGGIVHNVATAQFLITWEKDGSPKVLKWWVEGCEDS